VCVRSFVRAAFPSLLVVRRRNDIYVLYICCGQTATGNGASKVVIAVHELFLKPARHKTAASRRFG